MQLYCTHIRIYLSLLDAHNLLRIFLMSCALRIYVYICLLTEYTYMFVFVRCEYTYICIYVSLLDANMRGAELMNGWHVRWCVLKKWVRTFLAGYEDTCLDIVFKWGTAGCKDLKVTRGVGHFDGAVTWIVTMIFITHCVTFFCVGRLLRKWIVVILFCERF